MDVEFDWISFRMTERNLNERTRDERCYKRNTGA